MKLNHVVIVYKKPSAVRGDDDRKKNHIMTVRLVEKILKKTGISYRIMLREKMEKLPPLPDPPPRGGRVRERVINTDLIITIGGDGTVLSASHYAGTTPVLGVNSMPKTSVGFFCAASAKNFKEKISAIKKDRLKSTLLPLLEASINGKRLPFLALNDMLFASPSPAETVQYTISVGNKKERQRGSGVWIAAGPGSTAGISSAGGKATAITSRRIQYLARELYPIPHVHYHLKRGFIAAGKSIRILSAMSHGVAFLDGAKLVYPMARGNILAVRIARQKLRIFL